jgi:hypothetical protein
VLQVAAAAAAVSQETRQQSETTLAWLPLQLPTQQRSAALLIAACAHQQFQPVDILVAAGVLSQASSVLLESPVKWQAVLHSTAAMRAHMSAITSVIKRAAVAMKTAGRLQQQPAMHGDTAAEASAALRLADSAAQNFPAVVPELSNTLLLSAAKGVYAVADQLQHEFAMLAAGDTDAAASIHSVSCAALQQSRASAALLVLLARSLVVLADAMEAAAAAAGMTPAQLFARCGSTG